MEALKILPFAAALLLGASSMALAQTGTGSTDGAAAGTSASDSGPPSAINNSIFGTDTTGAEKMASGTTNSEAFGPDMTGSGAVKSGPNDREQLGTGLAGSIADPDTSGLGPAGIDTSEPPSIMAPADSSGAR